MERGTEKPSIHLYLDDYRPCPPGFVLARNAEECTLLLAEHDVHILSLDYDLGWNRPTGLDVAKFIVKNLSESTFPREIYLHSSSAIGRLSMYQLLDVHKPEGVVLINGPMPEETLLRASHEKLNVEK
jgi:hypothetical protein